MSAWKWVKVAAVALVVVGLVVVAFHCARILYDDQRLLEEANQRLKDGSF